jgi:hypothetical protein
MITRKGREHLLNLLLFGSALERKREETQPGSPAFQARCEGPEGLRGKCGGHDRSGTLQEESHLFLRKTQVGGAQFAEIITRAQACQWEGGITLRQNHQVEGSGEMIEKKRHRPLHLGRSEDMVIFQDQHPCGARCVSSLRKPVSTVSRAKGFKEGRNAMESCLRATSPRSA